MPESQVSNAKAHQIQNELNAEFKKMHIPKIAVFPRNFAVGTVAKPYSTLSVDLRDYQHSQDPHLRHLNAWDKARIPEDIDATWAYVAKKELEPGPVYVGVRGKCLVFTAGYVCYAIISEYVDKYYLQLLYHKTDESGRPVYIECIGNLIIKALYACTSQEHLLQRLVVVYEAFLTTRLPACTAAAGRPIKTSLTILDLGGVSLSNFIRLKDYVLAATSIGHPEVLGAFYIVNAPWAFTAVCD